MTTELTERDWYKLERSIERRQRRDAAVRCSLTLDASRRVTIRETPHGREIQTARVTFTLLHISPWPSSGSMLGTQSAFNLEPERPNG